MASNNPDHLPKPSLSNTLFRIQPTGTVMGSDHRAHAGRYRTSRGSSPINERHPSGIVPSPPGDVQMPAKPPASLASGREEFNRDISQMSVSYKYYQHPPQQPPPHPPHHQPRTTAAVMGGSPRAANTMHPGNWLDDIPHIDQEAMADSNFNDGTFETTMMDSSNLQEMKIEQQSPTNSAHFTFSRTSSTGSVHAISCSSASSAHNTDDEDSDGTMKHMSYKDRRREAHTHAEQKRRDAIKKGYEELYNLLPANQQTDSLGSQKLSKAAVLQKSIEYMKHLTSQKKKQEDQLSALQKEVMALKIMKANYELIVQTHKNSPQQGQNQVSDEVKFQVFQHVMDMLFQSFNASISVATFAELSGCVFNWLEEHCKPQTLREFTMDILSQVSAQQQQVQPPTQL